MPLEAWIRIITLRSGLKSERIIVAKVFFRREWQFVNVFYRLDVIGNDVHLLKFVAIEWNVVINVFHNLVKAFALQCTHLITTHAFFVRIPIHN